MECAVLEQVQSVAKLSLKNLLSKGLKKIYWM